MSLHVKIGCLVQRIVAPQQCVLCTRSVCNPDWSPLCGPCLHQLRPFRGACCPLCGVPLPVILSPVEFPCSECRTSPPHFDGVVWGGLYQHAMREVIHSFKYGGFQRLAGPLGRLVCEQLEEQMGEAAFDTVVPVPCHWRRLRQRGFDHTRLLARSISRSSGVGLRAILKRVRHTGPQAGLSRRQRARNLCRAFAFSSPVQRGSHVLLVDDVVTTGTTAGEAARLLKRAGVARVVVATAARTPVAWV